MKRMTSGLFVAVAMAGGALAQAAPALEAVAPDKVGEVSVAAAAFGDDLGDEDCRVAKAAYAYVIADDEAFDTDCDLVAGIQLPDGADLRGLRCSLLDSFADNAMEAHLARVELATGAPQTIFTTTGTVDSGSVQMVSDGTPMPGTSRVDNAKFAYYLAVAFSYNDFTTAGNLMRVYGCTVAYR